MEKIFQIRTFGFGELAQLYFPHVTKSSASRMFSQWIYKNNDLVIRLSELSWKKKARYFTPKQVKIIIECFDPPY